jgi:serine/threonine protein phosphatase 1
MIKIIQGDKYKNIYVVGDIHGCYSLLRAELLKLNFNEEEDLLIGVGDLVDRGPENMRCVELLDKKWFTTIRGNHEDFCIEGNSNNAVARSHCAPNNGGSWFYEQDEITRQCVVAQFEQLPYLIELHYKGEKIGFAHADVPVEDWEKLKEYVQDDWQLEHRSIRDYVVWARKLVYQPSCYPNIENIDRVYLGHTVLPNVKKVGNCYFIDTGAVFTSNLTILKL